MLCNACFSLHNFTDWYLSVILIIFAAFFTVVSFFPSFLFMALFNIVLFLSSFASFIEIFCLCSVLACIYDLTPQRVTVFNRAINLYNFV